MNLSVIIVSYNAADFLRKCLNSVMQFLPENAEVIVFDNASPEREIEKLPTEFPLVNFILNDSNIGFSKANNAAVKMAKGKFILILNPDTIVYDNFFSGILAFAHQHPHMGALGVRMVDKNGKFLPESKRNIPNAWNSFFKIFANNNSTQSYYANHLKENQTGKVDVLSGACMLLRKEVFEKVGGFDEKYFMYGEDIDLSYTLLQHGFTNYYIGEITITHFKGESTELNAKYLERFYGAMEIFISKYYKNQKPLQYVLLYSGLKIKYHVERLKLLTKI